MRGTAREQEDDLEGALVYYQKALQVAPESGLKDELSLIIPEIETKAAANKLIPARTGSPVKEKIVSVPGVKHDSINTYPENEPLAIKNLATEDVVPLELPEEVDESQFISHFGNNRLTRYWPVGAVIITLIVAVVIISGIFGNSPSKYAPVNIASPSPVIQVVVDDPLSPGPEVVGTVDNPTQTPTIHLSEIPTETATPKPVPATWTPTITSTITSAPTKTPTIPPAPIINQIQQNKIVFHSLRDNNFEIYIMNDDGNNQINLTNTNMAGEYMAAVSPDGKFIAYAKELTPLDDIMDYELYIMNIDGTSVKQLTNTGGYNGDPSWSPDGRNLAFTSNRDGNKDIWILNLDSSQVYKITNRPEDELIPSWSPNGEYIAYQTILNNIDNEVFLMRSDGSDQINLSNNPYTDVNPTWSPDSQRLLFTSDRMGNRHEIFEMDITGANLHQITNNSVSDLEPRWSPDGKWIVYSSKVGDQYEIFKMKADGSGAQQLTYNSAHDKAPAWVYGR